MATLVTITTDYTPQFHHLHNKTDSTYDAQNKMKHTRAQDVSVQEIQNAGKGEWCVWVLLCAV